MGRPGKIWPRQYKTGAITWVCKIGGKLHTLGEDRQEAQRAFHKLQANRGQSKPAEQPDATVRAVVEMFLEYQSTRIGAQCFESYRYWLLPFAKKMGWGRLATSIEPDEVTDWLERAGRWNTTSRHIGVSRIKACYRRAKRKGWIGTNPLEELEAPPCLEREDAPTLEQFLEIVDQLDDHLRSLVAFMYETGCRVSEVCRLDVAHVDLDKRVARLPGKTTNETGKHRTIYLTEVACKTAAAMIAKRDPIDPVFVHPNGKRWTKDILNGRLSRIARRLGIPRSFMSAGSFRRAFATDCALKFPESVTAHLLGHNNTSTVKRFYVKLKNRPAEVRAALDQIRPPSETADRQGARSKPSRKSASASRPKPGKRREKPR